MKYPPDLTEKTDSSVQITKKKKRERLNIIDINLICRSKYFLRN